MKYPHFVISSYESYGWRTCILSSPGASPDTWPDEFQFTGSPRTSVLDFVTSEVDGVVWTRSTRPVFNLSLFIHARENHFKGRNHRNLLFCGLVSSADFLYRKFLWQLLNFPQFHFILFSISILVYINIYCCKKFLLLVSIIFIYIWHFSVSEY